MSDAEAMTSELASRVVRSGVDRRSAAVLQPLFDAMAPSYRCTEWASFGMMRALRRVALERLRLTPGMSVADLMCGPGVIWEDLSRAIGESGRILAIDFSERMTTMARHRASAVDSRNVTVLRENVLRTSLAPQSVDAIFCSFGLKLFDETGVRQLAAEVHRILKPGGSFVFAEAVVPRSTAYRALFLGYLRVVLPLLFSVLTSETRAFATLVDYVSSGQDVECFAAALELRGAHVEVERRWGGCARLLYGRISSSSVDG